MVKLSGPDTQQIYLVLCAFRFAFMCHELVLFTCYDNLYRQESLGNEVYRVQTTPTIRMPHHLATYWLFVFVTLETAIHIFVFEDYLQLNIMEYSTTPK